VNRDVNRETCACCRESRPRSGLHQVHAAFGGQVLACRDWYGCYQRFRARMIREGFWTVAADGKLYPVGRNRSAYQAEPGGPVLWTWDGPGQVTAGAA
jgi:hypothetical protein